MFSQCFTKNIKLDSNIVGVYFLGHLKIPRQVSNFQKKKKI